MKTISKKITAAVLSLGIAATAIPLTTTDADAGWRGRHYNDHYYGRHHRHRDFDAGSAAAAGIVGLAAGAIIGGAIANSNQQPVYDYRMDPNYRSRADWDAYCYSKYRSYDARTGTYLGYDGYRHYCR